MAAYNSRKAIVSTISNPLDRVSGGRTLNDADIAGFARRIAFGARQRLEAPSDSVWAHLPCFNEEVIAEATAILKTVIQHERLQAEQRMDDFIAGVLT